MGDVAERIHVGRRTKARERAVQALYQLDVVAEHLDQLLAQFWASFEPVEREVRQEAEQLVRGVASRLVEIDSAIDQASLNWRLDRMPRVDRNILRLAVYELEGRPEVPTAVVIDEAIELGKRFGSEHSASFINGILDKIAGSLSHSRP